ncbi:MAG TPA: cell wall hydrolase, partial [Clostridia bacterium]|nr:cell wall hydrolase [Clostridia bacterium]
HNPCGMKTSAGGPNNDPSAHQRFGTWEQGIRAQVGHLALYAGADGYPQGDTPDPRHFAYLHGTAKTVEELGGKWAGSATYGTDIVKMMEEIEAIEITEIEVEEPEPVREPEVLEMVFQDKIIQGVTWKGGSIKIIYQTKD